VRLSKLLESSKRNGEDIKRIMEFIEWKGFEFIKRGRRKIYSIFIEKSRAMNLLHELSLYSGTQREFYFLFVNPLKQSKFMESEENDRRRHNGGKNRRIA